MHAMGERLSALHPGPETAQHSDYAEQHSPEFYNSLESLVLAPAEDRDIREAAMLGTIDQETLINPIKRQGYREELATAIHEYGHATAIQSFGGSVMFISIIREGNTLGYTMYRPAQTGSVVQFYENEIAGALAGGVAAEAAGLNPDGCGSDHYKAEIFARRLAQFTREDYGAILSRGRQRAWDRIRGMVSYIRQKAHFLVKKKSVANA